MNHIALTLIELSLTLQNNAILARNGLKYLGSTYSTPGQNAPLTQRELIHRINQTVDKWKENLRINKQVYLSALERMNFFH